MTHHQGDPAGHPGEGGCVVIYSLLCLWRAGQGRERASMWISLDREWGPGASPSLIYHQFSVTLGVTPRGLRTLGSPVLPWGCKLFTPP